MTPYQFLEQIMRPNVADFHADDANITRNDVYTEPYPPAACGRLKGCEGAIRRGLCFFFVLSGLDKAARSVMRPWCVKRILV
jgi:hypothetical protein